MPFLTRIEFRRLVPQLADVLAPDDNTFETAEKDAAEVASRLSGYAVPEGAADAPAAVKRPVAHLIVHALAGTVQLTPERMAWARQVAMAAREDLAAERTRQEARPADVDDAEPRTGCIEDLYTW